MMSISCESCSDSKLCLGINSSDGIQKYRKELESLGVNLEQPWLSTRSENFCLAGRVARIIYTDSQPDLHLEETPSITSDPQDWRKWKPTKLP